jgi:hypothetical protein
MFCDANPNRPFHKASRMSDSDWRTDDEPDDGHVNPGQGTQGLGRIRTEHEMSQRHTAVKKRPEKKAAKNAAQICNNVGFVLEGDGPTECSVATAARQIVRERW